MSRAHKILETAIVHRWLVGCLKTSRESLKFEDWARQRYPEVPNPNKDGRKDTITFDTLLGYARKGDPAATDLIARMRYEFQRQQGAEQGQDRWLSPNRDPDRYRHIEFFSQGKKQDADEFREKYSQALDLSGAGGIASVIKQVNVKETQRGGKQIISIEARGDHDLVFEREISYEITLEEDKPHSIKNKVFAVDKTAPSGLGTKMLASQVGAAYEAGFRTIETHASRAPDLNGYYTWPRLGFNAELEDSLFEELKNTHPEVAQQVKELADKDPTRMWPDAEAELIHMMAIPEAREWWLQNGKSIKVVFPVAPDLDNSKSYHILREYTEAKANAEGKTVPEYISKTSRQKRRPANIPPELTEQDNQILDQAWDRLRERILSV